MAPASLVMEVAMAGVRSPASQRPGSRLLAQRFNWQLQFLYILFFLELDRQDASFESRSLQYMKVNNIPEERGNAFSMSVYANVKDVGVLECPV
jgi:hypothetical protein